MMIELYALKLFILGIFITAYVMRKRKSKPRAFYIREI